MIPQQAQSLLSSYQALQGESQKEQWARNLAKMAKISDAELDKIICEAQAKMQANQETTSSNAQPGQVGQTTNIYQNIQNKMMNNLTQQLMGQLAGGLKF